MLRDKVRLVETQVCSVCGKARTQADSSKLLRLFGKDCRCIFSEAAVISAASSTEQHSVELDKNSPEYKLLQDQLGDRYEILNLIGKGGMGSVYKVRHTELGKIYAVKFLKPEFYSDRIALKRFEHEAKAASKLTHANLVAVYDYGKAAKGTAFLVMDYLEGTDLGEVIKAEGFLGPERAVDIFIQVVEAVAHAHDKGVIHRDIKPSNIMVLANHSNDFVKLVDFGIAKVISADTSTQKLTQTGEVFGSPFYMSPEQCRGEDLDVRSDIYSVGCVMYETLTGQLPCAGNNPIQTVLKHLNDEPVPLSNLLADSRFPPELESTVMQCLAKDPDDRYQSAKQLLSDLQSWKTGEKLAYLRKSSGASQAKRGRRLHDTKRALIGVATILILLISAALVLIKFGNPLPPNAGTPAAGLKLGATLDPSSDAQALDSRAWQYYGQGKYEEAIALMELGLKVYKQNKGANDDRGTFVADNYQNIGECYFQLKDYKNADKYYKDALRIYSKYGNYKNSGVPQAVENYAKVLTALGRESEIPKMRKILEDVR